MFEEDGQSGSSLSRLGAVSAGIKITGKVPPKASLSPSDKHFFECDDIVHDDFTDSGKSITGFATNTLTGAAPNSVRMQSWYNNGDNGVISGGWTDPAGKDFLIMVCAQCVTGGVPSFYMGDGNAKHLRVQHYLAGYSTIIVTEPVTDTTPVPGNNYIYAAVYRNGALEHYTTKSDGKTVYHANDATVDLTGTVWDDGFNCSHGRINYDDALPTESDQDYFGFLVKHFVNGMPSESEIIAAMEYHLEQWPLNNKSIYPNWITEL